MNTWKNKRIKLVAKIISLLKKRFPEADCTLAHVNPLELLVATILSAQCTDKRVNIVTRELFKKYKTAADYAQADPEQFEAEIRSTGFYRNKARNIRSTAAKIVENFGGEVPRTMDELLTLDGVARKTANVVLGNAFGVNAGIVVDTHVSRIAIRLGLTSRKKSDATGIERDLIAIVPKRHWTLFPHLLIHHGRATCSAAKPACDQCVLRSLCPSAS